jgi:hypothetical protein
MAGPLGRNHDDIYIGTRYHLVVMHIEPMRERQRSALLDVGLDIAVIDGGNILVWQQHHDHVGVLDRLGDFLNLETGLFGLVPRSTALAQADRDLSRRSP